MKAPLFLIILLTLSGGALASDLCREDYLKLYGAFSGVSTGESPDRLWAPDYIHYARDGEPRPADEMGSEHIAWELQHQPWQSIHYPLTTIVAAGIPVSKALKRLHIPPSFHRFYDKRSGSFNYKNSNPIQLAPENGDLPIEQLRVHFHPRDEGQFQKLASDLSQVMSHDPELELLVLYRRGSKKKLDEILSQTLSPEQRKRVRSQLVKKEDHFQIYAQDDSKPTINGGLAHPNFEYGDFNRHPRAYQAALNAVKKAGQPIQHSQLYFHGGDMVVGEKHLFLGKNLVSQTQEFLNIDEASAIRAFEAEFGKPVFLVGPLMAKDLRFQMDFDIDFTLAVVRNKQDRKETVLLSSASRTLELLGAKFEKRKTDKGMSETDKKEFALYQKLTERDFDARREHNKKISAQLEESGYRVLEVPYFSLAEREQYSYANMVVGTDYVMLPQFEYPTLQQDAETTVGSLGYTVIPMNVASELVDNRAGPHCITCAIRSSR